MNLWINMKQAGEVLQATMDVKVVQAGEEITGKVLCDSIASSVGMLRLVSFDKVVTDPCGRKVTTLLYTGDGEFYWPDPVGLPGIPKTLTIVEVKDSDITK